ncbi:alpha/beta fold hydrolase [Rhodovulum sp. PH10]|uniref:alpha/beta fold hydrolase n=1 Tax=Rhodovulum sp. PH10 TaxID=1187851 RepID=UPI0012FC266B|nr:alpha/beta hydrolase [Rhodovulum sp. PH10]
MREPVRPLAAADVVARAAAVLARTPAPRRIATRGGDVECAVVGDGTGAPPVLALHGLLAGYDQAALHAACALGDGYRIVAPSRPGYLGTPLSVGASPAEQADVWANLLDALDIPSVAVAAFSAGSLSAFEFAVRHPDRCRGLVLVSACAARLDTAAPGWLHVLALISKIPPLARWLARQAVQNLERAAVRPIADPAMRARLLADPEAAALFAANLQSGMNRLAARLPGSRADHARLVALTDLPLARIAVPVLVVHGTADPYVPFAHAEILAAAIPGAETMTIAGGEHSCLFTHHAEIEARVRPFLAGLFPDCPAVPVA